ncbi:uroporphyrinogen decarboxylase [Spelaeicoccus albus]|uniref:Uroporphyrinogen decarboxylase n=1 Tax=Spelaeicoccus albus TaxID=1280376 RepID=A0A7Z0D3J0_9MICO|nr:uroporphyrinogen decarboxylase [Spelaeicoccus albus]NYI68176.1 uroporphyrinogen decarboxylase [Spelaeicoccus albus]
MAAFDRPAPARDSALVRAARGLPTDHVPVWFMRQAGRSLPEYRELRAGTTMLQACRTPELVTEITLQPVRRLGVDAAVFFSDIVVPLHAAGIGVDIVPGVGPVVEKPVRTMADVDALPELDAGQIDDIAASVRMTVAELGSTPLIGFAGAPFTLASYLIEGGPSKNHELTKSMMHGAPDVFDALLSKLSAMCGTFLSVQAAAGASALQLFDSWAGYLSAADYRTYVLPHSRDVFAHVARLGLPTIHFGVQTGELLAAMGEAGPDVVGVDFRVSLSDAAVRVPDTVLQGNLDPAFLFAPWDAVRPVVDEIVRQGSELPGHIFNLGHGVLPTTDPDMLARVVDRVHDVTS